MIKLKVNELFAIALLMIAVLTIAAAGDTAALTSPTSCGSFTNGLTLLPCQSSATTNADATVTSSIVATQNITVTTTIPADTVTKTISQVFTLSSSITSTSVVTSGVVTSATGFCFGGAQDILTPCTQLMATTAAAAKVNQAPELQNPFRSVTKFFNRFEKSDELKKALRSSCPWEILQPVFVFFIMILEVYVVCRYWGEDFSWRQGLIRGVQAILLAMIIALGYVVHMGDPHELFGF